MEKDQIILLEDRGLISITGEDTKNFLQNIITNDIDKVSFYSSIFSGLFTPQGKYLFEFFLIQTKNGYLLDCDNEFTKEIINYLLKYKLRSKIEITDISTDYVIGLISSEKFLDIQESENKTDDTIEFRDSPLFLDPRNKNLGARILSSLEKLHLTIKKLDLKIVKPDAYFAKAHSLGIPIKGIENLKDQLFGLEANFEELNAIDFKKGCYIGQENTARMKLKEKLRRRLLPISSTEKLNLGEEIEVKVLSFDKEKLRVSLGLKQIQNDPWEGIEGKYSVGGIYEATVSNLTDYGCFAELEQGVEGLIHLSELDWTNKNIHPSKVVTLEENIRVMILELDNEKRRISLGLKQTKPNPWLEFENKYNIGDSVEGSIKSITDFGVFVGLEGDIDGLIHLSDLSDNENPEEDLKNYNKGDKLSCIIFGIDAERERISLKISD